MRSLLILMMCLFACGCGAKQKGPALVRVTGKVAFDGNPVESGRIQFRKTDGDQRAFAGDIANGTYALQSETGNMKVEITASRIIPGKFDNSNGTPEPVGEMYIPAKYNTATTLTAEVKPSATNDVPFELTSK